MAELQPARASLSVPQVISSEGLCRLQSPVSLVPLVKGCRSGDREPLSPMPGNVDTDSRGTEYLCFSPSFARTHLSINTSGFLAGAV